jgi:hypothetical protein
MSIDSPGYAANKNVREVGSQVPRVGIRGITWHRVGKSTWTDNQLSRVGEFAHIADVIKMRVTTKEADDVR